MRKALGEILQLADQYKDMSKTMYRIKQLAMEEIVSKQKRKVI